MGYIVQAMLQKRKDKKKDKKKQKAVDFEDGPPPGQGTGGEAAAAKGDISAPQQPREVTAEELADEEFGPVKEKKGKKKGVNKPKEGMCFVVESRKAIFTRALPDEEDEAAPETSQPKEVPAPTVSETVPGADDDDGDAGDGPKLLSKKEKEKIKKEKERAKKKVQATAKKVEKAVVGGEDEAATPAPGPAASALPAEGGDEDEGGEDATASKNKKKKKKKKKGEEEEEEDKPAPAPAPAPAAKTVGKKAGGQLAALRAMMEERKRLEEEAKRKEEEARRFVLSLVHRVCLI
jgi:translation initiation factor 5B